MYYEEDEYNEEGIENIIDADDYINDEEEAAA
jgi:hypothetical protein